MSTVLDDIINKLLDNKLTISTCESVTGGMIGSMLVGVPGASKVYLGGLITYTNTSKVKMAGVSQALIDKHGAISKEVAIAMVKGTASKFNTDLCVAITGNAGPSPDEDKPVGVAYLAIAVIDKIYIYELKSKSVTRNDIRIDFVCEAYEKLSEHLDKCVKNYKLNN